MAANQTDKRVTQGPLVERPCGECKSSGVAEYIDHMARSCDACHGEGVLKFTAMEAGLLDQCEQQEARILALESALTDARLFVDLVRTHWSNWHDHPEQVAEAADGLKKIDAALEGKHE
jgi:hypothetical protein